MDFLDRLLGRPTLDSLIRQVSHQLRSQGLEVAEVLPNQKEIVARRQGDPIRIYLGNLFHDYARARRADRAGTIAGFLSGVVGDDAKSPTNYAQAKPLLLPVVRSSGAIGVAMTAGLRAPDGAAMPAIVHRHLVADLEVSLVVDRPRSMAYVNAENLKAWSVSFDQAFEDALQNLRGLREHGGWAEIHPGLWQGMWGDTYESSRLLLPDLIHRLGVSDPVAMVPFRDVLLVTSGGNAQGLKQLVEMAAGSADRNTRWVSFELLKLNGTLWESFAPPDHSATVRDLSKRNLADAYASQKQILDAHFQERGVDIFVASHSLAHKVGEGLSSYAVWSEGVDTLMPEADMVAFYRPDHKGSGQLILPWAVAQEHFGPFFEPTDYTPTRYRLRGFPQAQALEAVRSLSLNGL